MTDDEWTLMLEFYHSLFGTTKDTEREKKLPYVKTFIIICRGSVRVFRQCVPSLVIKGFEKHVL